MEPLPTTMRGAVLTGHSCLEMLELRDDLPLPHPGPRDVLIRVSVAGVNNTDINTRTGWYSKQNGDSQDTSWAGARIQFPRIQGADVCGRIVAVGSRVSDERLDERVLIEPCLYEVNGQEMERPWYFGSECDGGFAEYTVVASRYAHRVDGALSDVQLASFPCSYSTAENMLSRANVDPGERVLIPGASGGVGSASLQLAKARGARVDVVTSASKAASLRDLGADRAVMRDEDLIDALGRDSIDVVIDLVAGVTWPQLLDVLRPGGRYATAGAIAGPLVELDVGTLYLKGLSPFGCTVLDPPVFANLISRIEANQIVPLVAQQYPLDRIAEAQTVFLSKQHVGKIVLKLDEPT